MKKRIGIILCCLALSGVAYASTTQQSVNVFLGLLQTALGWVTSSHDFGSVTTGTMQNYSTTLNNTGTTTASVTFSNLTSSAFAVYSSPSSWVAGASQKVKYHFFAPSGAHTGHLIASATDSSATLTLTGTGSGSSCPAYGSELASGTNGQNAAAATGITEGNNTTGWASANVTSFTSDSAAPGTGTYNLQAVSVGAASTAAITDAIVTNFSLSEGTLYKVSYQAKHGGTGSDWNCGFNYAGSTSIAYYINTITSAQNTWATYTYFIAPITGGTTGQRLNMFGCRVANTTQSTINIDNVSIKTATPCYGSELYTGAADSTVSEANSVGNWVAANSATLNSVTTAPHGGTYHIETTAAAADSHIYLDLSAYMTAGHTYQISFWARHNGTGGIWGAKLRNSSAVGSGTEVLFNTMDNTDTTYRHYVRIFTYTTSYRYLVIAEGNASNDGGVYIDDLSIKEVTGE